MLYHTLKPADINEFGPVGGYADICYYSKYDAHDAAYSDWIMQLGELNLGVAYVVKRNIEKIAPYFGHESHQVY